MSDPTAEAGKAREPHFALILFGLTLLYTVGYFAWYGGTVLGLQAVLDTREILYLAQLVARGEFPGEFFYRAPLFPAVLTGLLKAGVPSTSLLFAVRCLNGICHLLSTMLVFWTARRIWQRPRAAFFSGLLYGLNPVAVYFAGDAFDVTMGIALLLAGLYFAVGHLLSEPGMPRRWRDVGLASLFFALGALARPQIMIVVMAWPVIVFLHAGRDRWRLTAAAAAALCVVFNASGAMTWALTGKYVLIPSAAHYHLYVANKEGANGRYYTQVLDLRNAPPNVNTGLLESQLLYAQATGQQLPVDNEAMNKFWRAKFFERVRADPMSWIRLLAWKTYYAINRCEQYNNKTYALQKELSPWLRLNPMNWSVVFLLGVGGVVIGYRSVPVRWIFFLASLYTAGLVLFLVSDRHRLVVVPLLAIVAGGWLGPDRKPWRALAVALVPLGFLTFTTFGHANDKSTFVEDYILMGRAALEIGWDDQAETYAGRAIELAPSRPAPQEIQALARYNRLLAGLPALPGRADLEQRHAQCIALRTFTDKMHYVAGVYAWLLGNRDEAVNTWQGLVDAGSKDAEQALAALVMAGRLRSEDKERIAQQTDDKVSTILLLARAATGDEAANTALLSRMTQDQRDAELQMMRSLFRHGGG